MVNKEHIPIREWLPRETIEYMMAHQKDNRSKAAKRLRFVISRYDGRPIFEICEEMGITVQTGYNWQNEWNESGTGSLDLKKQKGRPPKIDEETLNGILETVDREQMTTGQARSLIKDRCGVTFTKKHVRTILRKNGFIHPDEYLKGLTGALFPEYRNRKEKPWVTKGTLTGLIYEKNRD